MFIGDKRQNIRFAVIAFFKFGSVILFEGIADQLVGIGLNGGIIAVFEAFERGVRSQPGFGFARQREVF